MELVPDNSGEKNRPPGAAIPPSLAELDVLIPAYQFVQFIDSGGMGAVYKAVQKSLNRIVAIKLLPSCHKERDGFVERFRREAEALAKLNHSHIISVYDFGETSDGQMYYAMEFVDGMDLYHLLRRDPPSPKRLLEILLHVGSAIQYAHDHNIVHRDIKPANILINEQGDVKVADFGLAKILGPQTIDVTATGTALGAPDYIAPEATEHGVVIDHRVDIYSFGVMIYEAFTGQMPKGNWAPASRCAGTDKRLDLIVSRAMKTEPGERFQQVREMTQALEKLVKGSENWRNYRRRSSISASLPPPPGLAKPAASDAMTQQFNSEAPPAARGHVLPWVAGIVLVLVLAAITAWQTGWLDQPAASTTPKTGEKTSSTTDPKTKRPKYTEPPVSPAMGELLRWVFDNNAFVNVSTEDELPRMGDIRVDLHSWSELPHEPFTVWRVSFGEGIAQITEERILEEMVPLINAVGTVTNLSLRGLDVPSAALRHLSELETLTNLDLSDSPVVTEQGVPYIVACKNLTLLRIGSIGQAISPAIVQQIRSQLPACTIKEN